MTSRLPGGQGVWENLTKSDGVGGWGCQELSDITEVSFCLKNSDQPKLTDEIRNVVTSCKCLASIICESVNFAQPDGEAMAIKQVK